MNHSRIQQYFILTASAILLPTSNSLLAQAPDTNQSVVTIDQRKLLRSPAGIFTFLNNNSKENQLERMISYGQWDALNASFLNKLPPATAKQVYQRILTGLATNNQALKPEERLLTLNEVIKLADIAPAPLTQQEIQLLGKLAADSLEAGYPSHKFLARLNQGSKQFGTGSYLKKKNTSLFLLHAGLTTDAYRFLPSVKTAIAQNDTDLVALHIQLLTASTNAPSYQQAIPLIDWLLEHSNAPSHQAICRDLFLKIYPTIPSEQRLAWLHKLQQQHPEFVNSSLIALYEKAQKHSKSPQIYSELIIAKSLISDLIHLNQKSAATAPSKWKNLISPYALLWLQQVNASEQQAKKKQTTRFRMRGSTPPKKKSLSPQELATSYPLPADLPTNLINPELAERLLIAQTRLLIRIGEINKAFKNIQTCVSNNPKQARTLCNELLVTWSSSVNPNLIIDEQAKVRGRSQKKAIPLTRIRQIQNLKDLKKLHSRIKALHIGDVSDQALVTAFDSCHSAAETYKLSDIIAIFGPLNGLSTSRMNALVGNINQHLHQAWADEKIQKNFRTGRSKKELKQSMEDGYNLMISLINAQINKHDDYQLRSKLGNIYSDWAHYEQEQSEKNNPLYSLSNFSKKLDQSFQNYEKAITLYQKQLAQTNSTHYDISPYLTWFTQLLRSYESPTNPSSTNLEKWGLSKLRKLILETPHPEQHMNLFGEAAMQKLNSKAKDKKAYIDAALIVLQDHPAAKLAKKYQQYYSELVNEIQLVTSIQPTQRANNNEIGLLVTLQHTDQISRECHGFYQFISSNSSDEVNYRERFTRNIRTALDKSFKIKSITFSDSTRPPPPPARP